MELVDTRLYWGFSVESLSPIGFTLLAESNLQRKGVWEEAL
jgi:hypothetical protein